MIDDIGLYNQDPENVRLQYNEYLLEKLLKSLVKKVAIPGPEEGITNTHTGVPQQGWHRAIPPAKAVFETGITQGVKESQYGIRTYHDLFYIRVDSNGNKPMYVDQARLLKGIEYAGAVPSKEYQKKYC
ncbi:Uncharacterised protein [Legionella busanensis]|uniref:Uncharacterized protein n=1 Tax=Legionella busanensis TaxID=190655 RepID=A0A378JI76_9GAMM|nr:hypothetical protein [Legionella busanensis]STX51016.1 Uncharacterised protein [Legionella busanensis]